MTKCGEKNRWYFFLEFISVLFDFVLLFGYKFGALYLTSEKMSEVYLSPWDITFYIEDLDRVYGPDRSTVLRMIFKKKLGIP